MKSLEELLNYYKDIKKGMFATSEQNFGSGSGRVELGKNRMDIDSSLLYDTDRLAKAAVASYLASSQLRLGGLYTWGEITLYYAQFHIINAMLRLVGIAPVDKGRKLLLRTDENHRAFTKLPKNDEDAKRIGFTGGGSHREAWRMFGRNFRHWTDAEPEAIASVLTEDPEGKEIGFQGYEFPVVQRNEANYLQSNAGFFFPETDFSGLQGWTVGIARTMGNWDWLRTDDNPMSNEDPPEAYFFAEMMAWDLIKYVIRILVTLEGQYLLEQYIWIIEHLDAYDELREHLKSDLGSISVK